LPQSQRKSTGSQLIACESGGLLGFRAVIAELFLHLAREEFNNNFSFSGQWLVEMPKVANGFRKEL
jgi:hypothetical protein